MALLMRGPCQMPWLRTDRLAQSRAHRQAQGIPMLGPNTIVYEWRNKDTYIPCQEQQTQLRERLATYLARCSPTFQHALLRHHYGGEQIYYLTFQRAKHLPGPEQAPPHTLLAFALELAILVIAAQLLVRLARTEEWQHLVHVAQRDRWNLDTAFQSAQLLLSHATRHPECAVHFIRSSENKRLSAPLFGFSYHPEQRRYVADAVVTSMTDSAKEGNDGNA